MPNYICVTCGTQYPESHEPPASCPICEEDRQYVNPKGQQWTTMEKLRSEDHHNVFHDVAEGVTAIASEPGIGIGQQTYLIQTPHGNVLWDLIAYLDDETIEEVNKRGGLNAIAISHPHFYTTMVEWSRVFDAPVHLHHDNQPWVMRPDEQAIRYWEGEAHELMPGMMLIRCGGHFPGSSVLHRADAFNGKGALFTGDTIYVVADNRWVSFMYSYPNLIPLGAASVRAIVEAVEPYQFDRLYGAFGRAVESRADEAVQRSARRYIEHIQG